MRRFLKKPRDMQVQDYIARVIKINDYLAEFPTTMVGGNTSKLSDDKLLDLLEFGITIKWQRQMQVQNFKPTARTLRDFQDFCERLESALDKPVTEQTSKKTSGQEKGNKKRRRNNNNKDKKHFCMLHGKNPTHSTKQCRTLKKEAESIKNSQK